MCGMTPIRHLRRLRRKGNSAEKFILQIWKKTLNLSFYYYKNTWYLKIRSNNVKNAIKKFLEEINPIKSILNLIL